MEVNSCRNPADNIFSSRSNLESSAYISTPAAKDYTVGSAESVERVDPSVATPARKEQSGSGEQQQQQPFDFFDDSFDEKSSLIDYQRVDTSKSRNLFLVYNAERGGGQWDVTVSNGSVTIMKQPMQEMYQFLMDMVEDIVNAQSVCVSSASFSSL